MASNRAKRRRRSRVITPRVVLGISGTSGAAIGLRVFEILLSLGAETHLVVSRAAAWTFDEEIAPDALPRLRSRAPHWRDVDNIGAAIASGSFSTAGMIIAPCTIRTLSAIANCNSDSLLTRASDVHLKERRPLILLARETRLCLGYLRLMTATTEAGAIIMPPAPTFYLAPKSIDDIIDQIAHRAVDLLRVFKATAREWRGLAPFAG